MKKIFVTILCLILCGALFSQTTNTKTNSDTTKTTTNTTVVVKKKLIRVTSDRVNAVSSATIKVDKANSNNNGTKEEDTQPK